MVIQVQPVRSARERRIFLHFPWRIYTDDPLWVPPLLPERRRVMDPRHGAFFKRGGEAEFFIAWQDGVPVGTICAGEDPYTNGRRGRKDCVFGFLEYIEEPAVLEALIARAAAWARQRGLTMLWGPFNLDYENSYGVLIEGRDRPPALLCGHSPPYYVSFMEALGFTPARADNIAMAVDITEQTAALRRLAEIAAAVRRRRRIIIRQPDFDHLDREIDRIHVLLNKALAHLPDHIGWHRDAVEALIAPFREIADPELVLFADVDGETVGWLPGIPNLNEVFIHVNGLRHPWNYAQLWWRMRRRPLATSLTIKSVLILPEYWGTGIAAVLFDEMAQRARSKGYQWVDLSITSEDNPQTPLMGAHMGARVYKRWRVYQLVVT